MLEIVYVSGPARDVMTFVNCIVCGCFSSELIDYTDLVKNSGRVDDPVNPGPSDTHILAAGSWIYRMSIIRD